MIPDEYQIETGILIFLCGIKLYENFLGHCHSILFNSDYYRLVLMIGIGVVILAIIFNIVFIPRLGMWGAAIATFSTFFAFFSVKLFLVYQKFHMHPFTSKTLPITGLIIVSCLLFYFGVSISAFIAIKILTTVLYAIIAFKLNLSEELRNFFSGEKVNFNLFLHSEFD